MNEGGRQKPCLPSLPSLNRSTTAARPRSWPRGCAPRPRRWRSQAATSWLWCAPTGGAGLPWAALRLVKGHARQAAAPRARPAQPAWPTHPPCACPCLPQGPKVLTSLAASATLDGYNTGLSAAEEVPGSVEPRLTPAAAQRAAFAPEELEMVDGGCSGAGRGGVRPGGQQRAPAGAALAARCLRRSAPCPLPPSASGPALAACCATPTPTPLPTLSHPQRRGSRSTWGWRAPTCWLRASPGWWRMQTRWSLSSSTWPAGRSEARPARCQQRVGARAGGRSRARRGPVFPARPRGAAFFCRTRVESAVRCTPHCTPLPCLRHASPAWA